MNRCYLVLVACLGLAQVGWGQSLIDNFNGSTINTSVWNTFNPSFGNGGLSESSGVLTFRNGSYITTVNEFNMPTISGRFSFSGWEYDRLKIILRSDGTMDSYWQEPVGGLRVEFTPSSNPDYGASSTLHFYDLPNGNGYNMIGSAAPDIAMNTYYDFKIVDSGNLISVFWDNNPTPIFSYATSVSYGNFIQIGNRAQSAGWPPPYFANLDYISIIPEPSSLSLLALGGVVVALRRKR